MIIKKVAIGNKEEAFIENRFCNGVNIISSDDNNKGKTIVIQSLMHCLGNKPAFPFSLQYQNYYCIVEFEHNGFNYLMGRKGDTFAILKNDSFIELGSVGEMKRYWNKEVISLPLILKNDIVALAGPDLFVQLFFVGQDKKDTTDISNKGQYTKDDFFNMIYSMKGLRTDIISSDELELSKKEIKELKQKRKELLKRAKILRSSNNAVSYLSSVNDQEKLHTKMDEVEKIMSKISNGNKKRTKAMNEKLRYESVIRELNSLNKKTSYGEIRCLNCGSDEIAFFSGKDDNKLTFEVSTAETRSRIIKSINEKVDAYAEEIQDLTHQIEEYREELNKALSDEEIDIESIIMIKKDVRSATDYEREIIHIDSKLNKLKKLTAESNELVEDQKIRRKLLIDSIINEMNEAHKVIDGNRNVKYQSLFAKSDQIYSGSEATEFHIAKLYAYAKVFPLQLPFIVDSFRAEDLSTEREKRTLDLIKSLDKQAILTTTLKEPELGKYDGSSGINHIDYSPHAPHNLLDKKFVQSFYELINRLLIEMR